MRQILGLAVLFAALGYAQPVTRTVQLVHTTTPQGVEEAATVLRTVCDVSNLSVDAPSSSVTVTGQPDLVALAEWTLTAIDATGPMAAQQYRVPGGKDDIVKVVYLTNTNSPQAILELISQLRIVVELARVFTLSGTRGTPVVVFRGNSALIDASTWLIAQLDKPFTPGATPVSYQLGREQVRVYYLHNIAEPKPTQELLTAIRMQTKVGHAFVSNEPRAVAVRGTADQLVAADAIVAKLDIPAAR